jgi:arginyl-tRNA synthetase
MNILAELRHRFRTALVALDPNAGQFAEMVLPSQDAKFGDYQANCAMPLGKQLGKPPREIAQQLIASVEVSDICDTPEIAGPGFINLKLKNEFVLAQLKAMLADTEHLGVVPNAEPRTLVLDYSAPNVAKPMHVGHIRSTVIGSALYRVLKELGHRVISDNHIGDWGTQFGMIIYGYKNFVDEAALQKNPVSELSRLYRLVNQLVEFYQIEQVLPTLETKKHHLINEIELLGDATELEDPKRRKEQSKRLQAAENALEELRIEENGLRAKVTLVENDPLLKDLVWQHMTIRTEVLNETAKLHAGDKTNRELWERFLPACLEANDRIYRRLKVTFDHTLGESFYEERLAGVVEDLTKHGLVKESDGAKCVFLAGIDAPFIVQKKDGAFLYATTDLATIQYRMETWSPDAILYVVDHRQSLHFEQLFATARLWGFDKIELEHISFGTVLGEDGKPYKTRSGTAVGLDGLLDEAVERAHAIVCANDDGRAEPLLSAEERLQVAERVGIGAIKYADLAHNRTSDYVFSYDKMLAMQGNTAAYMQYSYARVRSIFAKGNVDPATIRQQVASLRLDQPAERALALSLVQLVEALERVAGDYRPNHLTAYLFDLASKYSSFFENCPVLKAESDEIRTSRLLLCDLTARTIAHGLNLLGIEVVERM